MTKQATPPTSDALTKAVEAVRAWDHFCATHPSKYPSDEEIQQRECLHGAVSILSIAAVRALGVRGEAWRSMDDAPKDGSRVLLHIEGVSRAVLGQWNGAAWDTLDANDWTGRKVLHWHPLPAPPAALKEQAP